MEEPVSRQRVVQLERVKLAFTQEGEGPPLLLLHGLPGPCIWDKLLPYLTERVHCICPHTLGLGGSDGGEPEDHGLEAQANAVRHFLDRAKIERVHVLGHDLGAVMAMAMAVRHPHRVVRLVLSHAPPREEWEHPLLAKFARWARLPGGLALLRRRLGGVTFATSDEGWGEAFYDPDTLAAADLPSWNQALAPDRLASFRRLLKAVKPPVSRGLLAELRSYQRPTMLLWGCDYPPLSPSWAVQLYHEIPGAKRFELIPFAGHFPQWEKPEAFARAVLDFVAPRPRAERQQGTGNRQ